MTNIIKFKSIIFCLFLWFYLISVSAFPQESLNTVIIDDNSVDDSKKNNDTVKVVDLDKKSPTIDNADKNTDKKEKQENNKNSGSGEKVAGIEDILLHQKPVVSLMFSDADQKNINRAIMAYKAKEAFVVNESDPTKVKSGKKKAVVENEKSFLHLSSIIYFSPDSWSLWIDSNKISSDSNKVGSDLYIKSISPEKITIIWTMSISKWKILSGKTSEKDAPKINQDDQVEIEFTLRQNQTYMLTTNKIIEGKINVINDKPQDNNGSDVAPKNP